MALESATYINQLVATNPLGSDPIASGDDHIRLIKSALQATFPGLTGPVTVGQSVLNNPFPVGGIIMWSGSIVSIPSGWALCDGTSGTPDLRDRFIVGAGSTYAVGATGGVNTVTLDSTQIPSHTHLVSGNTGAGGDHTHSISDPGHTHYLPGNNWIYNWPYGHNPNIRGDYNAVGADPVSNPNTSSSTTGISIVGAAAHTHTISITSAATGGGLAHENRPPYYALAYIMKV